MGDGRGPGRIEKEQRLDRPFGSAEVLLVILNAGFDTGEIRSEARDRVLP